MLCKHSCEVQSAWSETRERQRDTAIGMDDLVHMTRENQLLHDELLRGQQQDLAKL